MLLNLFRYFFIRSWCNTFMNILCIRYWSNQPWRPLTRKYFQFVLKNTLALAAWSDVINSSGALLKMSLIRYCTSVPWSVKKNRSNPSRQIAGWRLINVNHLCKPRLRDSKKCASDTILFGGNLGIILQESTGSYPISAI